MKRTFDLGDHEVTARFYTPILAPGGEFQCRWQITWPDREQERYACGIDGLQALTLAMGPCTPSCRRVRNTSPEH